MLYESPAFRLVTDDRAATLWLDFRGRASHSLTLRALTEFSLVLDRAATLPADVLVVRSSRKGVFLDPFDVAELAGFTSPMEFAAFATRGQELTRKLAGLPMPTVAVLEGRCGGAGLEIALACMHRIAVNSPEVRLDLNEPARGLIPCWGSTRRLPRLIGVRRAVEMMTASGPSPRRSLAWGLLDQKSSRRKRGRGIAGFIAAVQDRQIRPRAATERLLGRLLGSRRGLMRRI